MVDLALRLVLVGCNALMLYASWQIVNCKWWMVFVVLPICFLMVLGTVWAFSDDL